MSNQERYRKLVEAVQANGGLWIAESTERTLVLPNECGEALILVWPTAEAALAVISARPDLSAFKPVYRSWERWRRNSTPHLTEDGILVAAYPDEQLCCLRVPAMSFARGVVAVPALQGKDLSRLQRKVARRRTQGKDD